MSLGAAEAIRAANDLLETVGDDPVVAWWHVDIPALIVGRGDRHHHSVIPEIPVVRRASGGGPVLWGPHLVAFDVILPRSHPLHTRDITAAYEWLGSAVAQGLTDIGLPARAVPPGEAHSRNDPELAAVSCFAGVSPWEVLVGDRKVGGLSQIRRRTGLVLQAGVVARPEDPPLWRVLGEDASMGRRLAERTTSLAEEGVPDHEAARVAIDRRVAERLAASA